MEHLTIQIDDNAAKFTEELKKATAEGWRVLTTTIVEVGYRSDGTCDRWCAILERKRVEKTIKDYATCELVGELKTREGVLFHNAPCPNDTYKIEINSKAYGSIKKGPCVILEVFD